MNLITVVKGIWNIKSGHFKQRMGYWSNDNYLFEGGRKQEMYGRFLLKHNRKKTIQKESVV